MSTRASSPATAGHRAVVPRATPTTSADGRTSPPPSTVRRLRRQLEMWWLQRLRDVEPLALIERETLHRAVLETWEGRDRSLLLQGPPGQPRHAMAPDLVRRVEGWRAQQARNMESH